MRVPVSVYARVVRRGSMRVRTGRRPAHGTHTSTRQYNVSRRACVSREMMRFYTMSGRYQQGCAAVLRSWTRSVNAAMAATGVREESGGACTV